VIQLVLFMLQKEIVFFLMSLAEAHRSDAARQKAKDAEVRKYLEGLESEALMKGKIFYRVQKVLHKSAVKLSGAVAPSQGTLMCSTVAEGNTQHKTKPKSIR
jgi:hypothetical protein